MRILQRYLVIAFVLCVVCAIYFALRDVAPPEVSRIDRTIKEGEPLQEASESAAFTRTIRGYTYTLTPRATYEISGLVVSQHRGDALFNLYHQADPGNIRDVCVVWGEAITNGSYRNVKFSSGEYVTRLSVVVRGNRLETDAGRYLGYTGLALFVALGWVWFVRPPVAE